MNNLNFKLWLEATSGDPILDFEGQYIDPDKIWRRGFDSETFIYDGEFLYLASATHGCNNESTHIDLLTHNDMLHDRIKDIKIRSNELKHINSSTFPTTWKMRRKAMKYRDRHGPDEMLFGRIATMRVEKFLDYFWNYDHDDLPILGSVTFVCFWGMDDDLFKRLLNGCLKELEEHYLINPTRPTFVSSQLFGTRNAHNISSYVPIVYSDEEKARLKMMEKLHLAAPEEKRIIMNKLGLASGGKVGQRGLWRDSLRDMGYSGYLRQDEGVLHE
jgi:hypothetical protein